LVQTARGEVRSVSEATDAALPGGDARRGNEGTTRRRSRAIRSRSRARGSTSPHRIAFGRFHVQRRAHDALDRAPYRTYLLKESLASILDRRQVNVAREKLEEWVAWTKHSQLAPASTARRARSR
jgi:hypothetical protein